MRAKFLRKKYVLISAQTEGCPVVTTLYFSACSANFMPRTSGTDAGHSRASLLAFLPLLSQLCNQRNEEHYAELRKTRSSQQSGWPIRGVLIKFLPRQKFLFPALSKSAWSSSRFFCHQKNLSKPHSKTIGSTTP